jgi:hypothetical protein
MSLAISMVLLTKDHPFGVAELERGLREVWPDGPALTEGTAEDNTVAVHCDGYDIILGKMPAPIPWSDLEGPCATSILWKDAATEVKKHTEHWIVTVAGPDDGDAIERAGMLTRATAAVMAACPTAIGVYWGNATMVIPRDLFIDFTKEILPKGPPLHIWIDFRVGRDSETTSAGFTCGMEALGHMEIETQNAPETPRVLRERFYALASYLLENGPVIQDGHTVGGDENERIRVVHAKSAFGSEGMVMRLAYERA